jgi:acyl-CoA thioesterase-1
MAPITDDPKLPRVLLIGDSISVGYTLPVRRLLAGKANVHRIPANGGPTTNGLARLAEWLGTNHWDVIHFNWGLHDLKLTATRKHLTPLPQYETNLVILTRRLKTTGAALIWASTTPIPRGKLSPPRDRGDEIRFNDAARRVMEQHGVVINDLHGFAVAQGARLQRRANVHFTPEGCDALAGQVADAILAELKKRGSDAHSPAPR